VPDVWNDYFISLFGISTKINTFRKEIYDILKNSTRELLIYCFSLGLAQSLCRGSLAIVVSLYLIKSRQKKFCFATIGTTIPEKKIQYCSI
jgi:hypothetical protein